MKNGTSTLAILLLTTLSFNPLSSQTQVGEDIDGETAEDQFGHSISLSSDGNRIAIGAPFNEENGINSGHVKIFEWNGQSWIQAGSNITGAAAEDQFGYSVSLSSDGNRVAIGALIFPGPGYIKVYEWNAGNWTQVGTDISGLGSSTDGFGFSVSLSSDGNKVVVGAPNDDTNGDSAGEVRVYKWNGQSWILMGPNIVGEAAGDESGTSVSLSSDGNRVAIGAPFNTSNIIWEGQVRVFEFDDLNWVQLGADIDGENVGYAFGRTVSLSSDGNRLSIGIGNVAGIIYFVKIYEWNGVNWSEIGQDILGEEIEDLSGFSLSLSSDGNMIAVGAPDNDGNGDNSGHVRVYEWNGVSWAQVGTDIDGEAAADQFGHSVSLSSDGSRIAIGAPANDGNGDNSGHVRVYEFESVSTIAPKVKAIIKVYPNPTSGKIELLGLEYGAIKIIDNFGRIILKSEKPKSEIDISDLEPGIYFIQINLGNDLITKKIIKK